VRAARTENLIKMHKGQLASNRTSCRSPLANQMRLILHAEHIEGCVERRRARRIPGPLVVLLAQPGLKGKRRSAPTLPHAS